MQSFYMTMRMKTQSKGLLGLGILSMSIHYGGLPEYTGSQSKFLPSTIITEQQLSKVIILFLGFCDWRAPGFQTLSQFAIFLLLSISAAAAPVPAWQQRGLEQHGALQPYAAPWLVLVLVVRCLLLMLGRPPEW